MGMFMPCVIDCFRAGAIGLYGGTIGVYLGVLSIFIWVCYKPLFWNTANLMSSICQVFVKSVHKKGGFPPPSCQVNAKPLHTHAK